MQQIVDIGERFASRVDASDGDDGCHVWTGSRSKEGYGRFSIRSEMVGAHRVAWWLASGDWPGEACVLHQCHNTSCVNPLHLELGDRVENNAQRAEIGGYSRGTHCHRGHKYDATNTYGYSICRTCINASERRRYRERKAESL